MIKKVRRLLSRRNRGGFTLAEVIVSSALLVILLLGMAFFISPVMSMIGSNEQASRADTVATSIEYYLSRSLRNASHIAIYTGASYDEVQSNETVKNEVNEMLNCVKSNSKNTLKCISIRKGYDGFEQVYKYFISNETFASSSDILLDGNSLNSTLDEDKLVFEKAFFRDLYFDIDISRPFSLDEPTELANSLKIVVRAFQDSDMNDASLIYLGTGYTELLNIANAQQESSLSLGYKVYPGEKDADNNPTGNFNNLGTGDDIFIYYVERVNA